MTLSGGHKHLYTPDRDYVGYGLEQPSDCWPNGAKIAVSFVLNYEEGGELSLWNGDDRSIKGLHELCSDRDAQIGRRDFLAESMYEYGIRQGLPRLLKLFDKYGYKFTVWMVARSAEVTGMYPKLVADMGHEIACHGNRWSVPGQDYEEAKWHINTSFDRLQAATGVKTAPTAWFMANSTMDTKLARAEVHRDRGVPLVYSSDAYAADTPYYTQDPLVVRGEEDHGLLLVPYSLLNNDVLFMADGNHGVGKADDFFDLLKADFDYLYAEGDRGHPKMMTIAMHSRVIGKPGRAMALKRFLKYISTKPDVWVCTREEIANQWRERFPYEKEGMTAALHAEVKKY
ncbi:allantoinase, partial [Tremellales sp. Uapishka_1]